MEFMKDSQGRLVPIDMVSDLDKLRDQTVRSIAMKVYAERDVLAKLKEQLNDELGAFLTLSSEQYGKTFGGKKGNVTLMTFDGSFKLIFAVNEKIVFDERLQVAKEIIDDCINRWSDGARSEIRALVNDAFYVDKSGKINTARILGLRRLDIKDPDWQKAMKAITDSIQVSGSKQYLRIYERGQDGEYHQVPLDVAAL